MDPGGIVNNPHIRGLQHQGFLLGLLMVLCWSFLKGEEAGKLLPLQERPQRVHLTTTVIIPCTPKHFVHIYPLLEHYANQTTLPDEVVISLSYAHQANPWELMRVKQKQWPFPVQLLEHAGKKTAGENRNLAFQQAHGDIIVSQDADDIPHPKRIEIVKHFFENYYVDHLMHSWFIDDPEMENEVEHLALDFEDYVVGEIEAYRATTFDVAVGIPGFGMHNGQACFSKEALAACTWPSGYGEDVELNRIIYRMYENTVVLKARLLMYRNYLSDYFSIFN